MKKNLQLTHWDFGRLYWCYREPRYVCSWKFYDGTEGDLFDKEEADVIIHHSKGYKEFENLQVIRTTWI